MFNLIKLPSAMNNLLPRYAIKVLRDVSTVRMLGNESQTLRALESMGIDTEEVMMAFAWLRENGHDVAYFGIRNKVTHTGCLVNNAA